MNTSVENSSSSSTCIPENSTDCSLYGCSDSNTFMLIYLVQTCTTLLVSLPLNMWVLWITALRAGGLMAFDIFAINLQVMEVTFCLFSFALLISFEFNNKALQYVALFSDGLILVGIPLCHCCICFERYLAVVYPVVFLKTRALKYMKYKIMCVVVVWLLALGFCWIILQQLPKFPLNVFAGIFIFVLAVEIFCSFSILRALRQPGPGDRAGESVHGVKRRSFNTVLIILVMMIVTYFPFICLFLLTENLSYSQMCTNLSVAFTLIMSCSITHPLIYLIRTGRLSRPRWLCKCLQKTG